MEVFFAYFALGLAVIVCGILLLRRAGKMKRSCTASTTAQIVSVEHQRTASSQTASGSDRVQYTPVYRYDAGGVLLHKRGRHYSYNRKQFRVGETVVLFYNPQNPEEFYVPKMDKMSRFGVIVMLAGVFFCVIAFTQL